jgi:hypothetical protein
MVELDRLEMLVVAVAALVWREQLVVVLLRAMVVMEHHLQSQAQLWSEQVAVVAVVLVVGLVMDLAVLVVEVTEAMPLTGLQHQQSIVVAEVALLTMSEEQQGHLVSLFLPILIPKQL